MMTNMEPRSRYSSAIAILAAVIAAMLLASAVLAGGSGKIKLGYVSLDEEGNESVAYRSFNEYEGAAFSLESIRYRFKTGHLLRADLKNITMNNRNLSLRLDNPGRYGISFYNSQYRRKYSLDGTSFTRRNQTGGKFRIYPHKNFKLYAGGAHVAKSGEQVDLFNFNGSPFVDENPRVKQDYNLESVHGGFEMIEMGGVLRGLFRTTKYTDDLRPERDQKRIFFTASTAFPVPTLEFVTLHAGYRRFETEYEVDAFELWSNFGWGGVAVQLPKGFNVRYNLYFDRAGSDSDYVETDNLANAVYLSYERPRVGGATVGYQHDINDDFEDEVTANSFYVSGWYKPTARIELRGQYGNRAEEVNTGSRLLGDEDRSRYRLTAKYRVPRAGSLKLRFENRNRKNDQIGTEADFTRFQADLSLFGNKYGTLSGGYAYGVGDYQNVEDEADFEFQDHLVYGDITTNEYNSFTGSFGATYYRSQRDLDIESISLRFTGSYRFASVYRLEVEYNVHNFDDLMMLDRYYTANIVNVNISRDFTL